VELSDARGQRRRAARITAHVLVTLIPRELLNVTRLAATYHDEAEKLGGRWWVTRSFGQYLSTEISPRVLPPATP
jgi:hypothetical protein